MSDHRYITYSVRTKEKKRQSTNPASKKEKEHGGGAERTTKTRANKLRTLQINSGRRKLAREMIEKIAEGRSVNIVLASEFNASLVKNTTGWYWDEDEVAAIKFLIMITRMISQSNAEYCCYCSPNCILEEFD